MVVCCFFSFLFSCACPHPASFSDLNHLLFVVQSPRDPTTVTVVKPYCCRVLLRLRTFRFFGGSGLLIFRLFLYRLATCFASRARLYLGLSPGSNRLPALVRACGRSSRLSCTTGPFITTTPTACSLHVEEAHVHANAPSRYCLSD